MKPRKPIRRRRQSKQAAQREAADKLWSAQIRSRGACEVCGSPRYVQAAHGFSRRYSRVRWNLLNGFCLCRGCHKHYTHAPLEWDDYLRQAWGEPVYAELRAIAQGTEHPDMDAVLAQLKGE